MAQYRMTQGLAFKKLEKTMREMQRKDEGVPIRCQKLFLTSIPSVFTGFDLVEWLMEHFLIPDEEAVHFANMICHLGYFFPVPITGSFQVKDDGGLYRFQAPFYWPSYNNTPDNTDYAVYLVKLLQSSGSSSRKCVLEPYEYDIYCKLRQTLSHKWELIIITAENQVRMQRQRKKIDKVISESQERAFWRIHRPPSGISAMLERGPRKFFQELKPANKDSLRKQRELLLNKIAKAKNYSAIACAKCLISYTQSYQEFDPFLVGEEPFNPWCADDPAYFELTAANVRQPLSRRVKRWSLSLYELLKDTAGEREFGKFLEAEFSEENLKFKLACDDLRRCKQSEVDSKQRLIYENFIKEDAPLQINIDNRVKEDIRQYMIGAYQRHKPLDHSSGSLQGSCDTCAATSDSKPTLVQSSCSNLSFSDRNQNSPRLTQSTTLALHPLFSTGSAENEDSLGAVGGVALDSDYREDPFSPSVRTSMGCSARHQSSSYFNPSLSGSKNSMEGNYSPLAKRHVFDKALDEIMLLMSTDPYQRFLKSECYAKLLNESSCSDKPTELHKVQNYFKFLSFSSRPKTGSVQNSLNDSSGSQTIFSQSTSSGSMARSRPEMPTTESSSSLEGLTEEIFTGAATKSSSIIRNQTKSSSNLYSTDCKGLKDISASDAPSPGNLVASHHVSSIDNSLLISRVSLSSERLAPLTMPSSSKETLNAHDSSSHLGTLNTPETGHMRQRSRTVESAPGSSQRIFKDVDSSPLQFPLPKYSTDTDPLFLSEDPKFLAPLADEKLIDLGDSAEEYSPIISSKPHRQSQPQSSLSSTGAPLSLSSPKPSSPQAVYPKTRITDEPLLEVTSREWCQDTPSKAWGDGSKKQGSTRVPPNQRGGFLGASFGVTQKPLSKSTSVDCRKNEANYSPDLL